MTYIMSINFSKPLFRAFASFTSKTILIAALCLPGLHALGDVEISISETSSGVTLSWDGSINTANLTDDGDLGAVSTGFDPSNGVFDGEGNNNISPNSSIYLFSVDVPNFSFGNGSNVSAGDVDPASSFLFESGNDELGLPLGYVSGANFSGSLLLSGQTISGLGIDTTPFEVILPDGAGTVFFFSTPHSDEFSDNSKDTYRWGMDDALGGAIFDETNTRVEYLVGTPDTNQGFDEARRPWNVNIGGGTDQCDVILDVSNNVLPNGDDNASIGLRITNLENSNDSIYIELIRSGNEKGFLAALSSQDAGGEVMPFTSPTSHASVTDGSVRLNYNPSTKIFTAFYDTTGSNDGFQWVEWGSFGVGATGGGSSRNSPWQIGNDPSFQVAISGFSEALTIPSGSVSADNFSITKIAVVTDTTAPRLRITKPSRSFRYSRSLIVRGKSNEALKSFQAKWTGSRYKTFSGRGSKAFKVKVPRSTLKKKRAVSVSVRGTDAAGNTSRPTSQRYKRK